MFRWADTKPLTRNTKLCAQSLTSHTSFTTPVFKKNEKRQTATRTVLQTPSCRAFARTSPILDTNNVFWTRFPQLPRAAFGTFGSVANPCLIAETNSHDSHPSCDQCTFTRGSPVSIAVSATTRVGNMQKRFAISMLCFTMALLTDCKRHAVTPTHRIHDVTQKKRITRRRQPRKNSTSEIIDGYLVCWTECHQNQMTHLLQDDNLRRREFSHHLVPIRFSR